jgi:SAM-dependent methyltransferase
MQEYSYNAADDKLPYWNWSFTSRIGDGTGDPEEEYLSLVKLIVNCRPNAKLLDVGCGLGRIIDLVRHNVDSLVGLEPDRERFGACYKGNRGRDRICIVNSTSLEYKNAHPGKCFDIVTVSMVLQHVPTAMCDQILRDVRDLLLPDGVAIIATTQQELERYTLQSDPTPRSVEEFDRYAEDTANQHLGVPVRTFSKASLREAIERAGLMVIHWGQFSYIRPEKLAWFAAHIGVAPETIQDVGTSQYAVVKLARA